MAKGVPKDLKKKLIFALIFVALFSFTIPLDTLAIGLSPSTVQVNNLRKENSVTKVMFLSRSHTLTDEYYKVTIQGDAARYVTVDNDIVKISAGEKRAQFSFTISPKQAPNGNYEAEVLFSATQPPADGDNTSGNSVAVLVGVIGKIKFSVTDEQILGLTILSFTTDDTEIGLPIRLFYSIENTGNVDVRPQQIVVDIVDVTDPDNRLKKTFLASELEIIAPGKRKNELELLITHNLPLGKYDIKAEFFLNGKVVFSRDKVRIHILPEGTLTRTAEFTEFSVSSSTIPVGTLVKFSANIKNTGGLIVDPVLFIEVKKDGVILDLLRSDRKEIRRGKDANYVLTYRPEIKGNYTAEAYFEYGIKRTDIKVLNFEAQSSAGSFIDDFIVYIIGGIILFILIVLFIFAFIWRKRKKNNNYSPPQPPNSGVTNSVTQDPPSMPTQPAQPTQQIPPPISLSDDLPLKNSPDIIAPTFLPSDSPQTPIDNSSAPTDLS